MRKVIKLLFLFRDHLVKLEQKDLKAPEQQEYVSYFFTIVLLQLLSHMSQTSAMTNVGD